METARALDHDGSGVQVGRGWYTQPHCPVSLAPQLKGMKVQVEMSCLELMADIICLKLAAALVVSDCSQLHNSPAFGTFCSLLVIP